MTGLFGIVALVSALVLLLVLNWGAFAQMGSGKIVRLALIWGVILVGGVLALKLLGYG